MRIRFWKKVAVAEPSAVLSRADYNRQWKKKAQAEFKRTGQLPPYVFHGSLNAYRSCGCRCEACRDVNKAYLREWRNKKAMAQ